MENDVLDRVTNVVKNCQDAQQCHKHVDPSTRLREDLGFDSLVMIDLIVAIEEQFDIVLDPVGMDFEGAFETVGSLAALVDSALEGKGRL